ncbi:hypothetical protein [Gloeothece verrucosa]|uniref:Uncharacterized protein n=1 Tax=Gloeothece verrucosa (strain PCC 7822) TaxID=497965 RepID=E0ULP9_GLOV7|nr:hypothetical protein [Gloeothece verrucosa]ADN17879.1 hypothetical protein Cyan7822_6032 [Gloeothece verrucosa PCC 7822]
MSPSIILPIKSQQNPDTIKSKELILFREEIQHNIQNREQSSTKNHQTQSSKKVDQFLKKCVYQGKCLHPRKFCRRWFGIETLDQYGIPRYTEHQILAIESEHGYREKCINLIARVLKIKPNTIQRWGKGVEFDKIPQNKREEYETYLGYIDTLRVMSLSIAKLNEDFLPELLHRLDFS